MKIDELKMQNGRSARKKPSDEEHRIQCACVEWFRWQYPHLRDNLIAIPNGGRRDAVTGKKLKDEGVLSGVADLFCLKTNGQYGALFIEMKTPEGRQSENQKRWQQSITKDGEYKYVVCRSLEDFQREIKDYLQ